MTVIQSVNRIISLFFDRYLPQEIQMIVEWRIYHCAPGRLPALHERFTKTTLGFFEKYGIEQVGFWTTLAGPTNQALSYLLKWASLAEREAKWNAFQADPGSPNARKAKHRALSSNGSRTSFWRPPRIRHCVKASRVSRPLTFVSGGPTPTGSMFFRRLGWRGVAPATPKHFARHFPHAATLPRTRRLHREVEPAARFP
ncbi:NIPSNAP protein [Pseudomonas agarici]|nr:NIPSNAP protein [Pseudomonas agarici]